MEEKIRGRRRIEDGGKQTPRSIFVSCVAVIDNKIVHEFIKCENCTKESSKEEIFAEAKYFFKEKYLIEPESMLNPSYEWKGTQVVITKLKEQIDSSEWVHIPGKKATAIYNDWEVTVRFFQEHDDMGFIWYNQSLVPGKKTKPAGKAINLSELKDLKLVG